jgi:HEAT repeat protein
MLAECEEDDETWAATDNEDGTGNDVHSAAIAAIGRFSIDMKENFILEAATPVFQQSLTNEDWKIRQAGYMTYGLVAESCRDFLKANLDSAM